ncbi:MAG TPA: hypothetical protein VFD91_11220 [Mariniphaga sp.]|nr:hypothetical protein [Mariniphaga sp.]
MEISDYFLELVSSGMSKDMALKKAKLKYLSHNEGRILSPQYWAGMMLIGNPDPIEGLNPVRFWYMLTGGIILFLLISFYIWHIVKNRYRRY